MFRPGGLEGIWPLFQAALKEPSAVPTPSEGSFNCELKIENWSEATRPPLKISVIWISTG
jgi:hypothetical protein